MKYFFLGLLCLGMFTIPSFSYAKEIDTDNDGLSDREEKDIYVTDENNPDTDGDGYLDGAEVWNGFSPHTGGNKKANEEDFDNDGLNNSLEFKFGLNIHNKDTDGDGYEDKVEVLFGYSPASSQTERILERKIVVDRTSQRLYFVVNNIRVLNFPVSTGNPGSETPGGQFSIQNKIEEKSYIGPGYNLPGVKWNMMFQPMYYLHAAYWHNDFGKRTHSHGCINLRLEDAEVLYKLVEEGFPVEVIGETPKKYSISA